MTTLKRKQPFVLKQFYNALNTSFDDAMGLILKWGPISVSIINIAKSHEL